MEMYYSDKDHLAGFYSKELHGGKIPDGSIKLSETEYQEAIQKSCEGKIISIAEGKLVYSDPKPTREESENVALLKRNSLLKDSDWTILPDSPFTEEQREIWKAYRQQLRDITKHKDFPDVSFPEKPF